MKVVLTDAYSPTNIGDGELVRLSVDSVKSRFGVTPLVLCTDKEGFDEDPRFAGGTYVFKPLSRVLWRRLSGIKKYEFLVREVLAIGGGLCIAFLPVSAPVRRSLYEMMSQILRVRWLSEISGADVIVGVGGGYLGDKYLRESIMTLAVYRIAHAAGASVETMPVSVSSAKSPLLRFAFQKFARPVKWRSREKTTHEILHSLDQHTVCVPDLAWLNASSRRDLSRNKTVVLAPLGSDFYSHDPNMEPKIWTHIKDLISDLAPTYRVALIAMHYWDDLLQDGRDDLECRRVADLIKQANPDLEVDVLVLRSYEEVLTEMAGAEFAVCERLHAALAGLSAGTPTKVIGYEPKHRGVLELAGLHVLSDESVEFVRENVTGDHIAELGTVQALATNDAVMKV